jgi:DeoR/GlpR family transcriptional regulator of sugar metabolism
MPNPLRESRRPPRVEKEAIARVAVSLIEDGQTVMLDAGSTTLQIARLLRHRRNVATSPNLTEAPAKKAMIDSARKSNRGYRLH